MGAPTITRKKKSEPLERDELSALKVYRSGFQTEVDCAVSIGIDRTVLGRVMLAGSGSPETIKKIRKALRKDGGTPRKATA